MTGPEEARIASEARLAALNEVYWAAVALDRDPNLWGYGGSKIVEMLAARVLAARTEAEAEAKQKEGRS